jgi:hypothetical protein
MDPLALAFGVGALAGYHLYLRQTPQVTSQKEDRPEHQLLQQKHILLFPSRHEFEVENRGSIVSSRQMLDQARDHHSMPPHYSQSPEFIKYLKSQTSGASGVATMNIGHSSHHDKLQEVYEKEFLPRYGHAILPTLDSHLHRNIVTDANKLSKIQSHHTGPKYVLAQDRTPIHINKMHTDGRFMEKQNYFDDNPFTTSQVGIVDQLPVTDSKMSEKYAFKANAAGAPYAQPRRAAPSRVETEGITGVRNVPEFMPRVQPHQFHY